MDIHFDFIFAFQNAFVFWHRWLWCKHAKYSESVQNIGHSKYSKIIVQFDNITSYVAFPTVTAGCSAIIVMFWSIFNHSEDQVRTPCVYGTVTGQWLKLALKSLSSQKVRKTHVHRCGTYKPEDLAFSTTARSDVVCPVVQLIYPMLCTQFCSALFCNSYIGSSFCNNTTCLTLALRARTNRLSQWRWSNPGKHGETVCYQASIECRLWFFRGEGVLHNHKFCSA